MAELHNHNCSYKCISPSSELVLMWPLAFAKTGEGDKNRIQDSFAKNMWQIVAKNDRVPELTSTLLEVMSTLTLTHQLVFLCLAPS